MRNRSGIFVAPECRISSGVITKIAAATSDSFCSFFETEVTSIFIRFSILTCVRSLGEDCEVFCDGRFCPQATSHPNRRNTVVELTRRAAWVRLNRIAPICKHTPSGPCARNSPVLRMEMLAISFVISVLLLWNCLWNIGIWSLEEACPRLKRYCSDVSSRRCEIRGSFTTEASLRSGTDRFRNVLSNRSGLNDAPAGPLSPEGNQRNRVTNGDTAAPIARLSE